MNINIKLKYIQSVVMSIQKKIAVYHTHTLHTIPMANMKQIFMSLKPVKRNERVMSLKIVICILNAHKLWIIIFLTLS